MGSAGRVFISYRRLETRHIAGRLADRLEDRLGSTQVFMDVNAIEPGADFAETIAAAVASCDVLIVLIGPEWITVADRRGRRRLDDPDDFVVLEVSAALDRGIRVIPVLIDGAPMPHPEELPAALHGLGRRHAVRVDHETFRADVDPLLSAVQRILVDAEKARSEPPPTPTTVVKERPTPPASTDRTPARRVGGLTAADVHNVAFSKPTAGRRGYDEDEVDAFLDLLENVLRDPRSNRATAADVHNVAFSKSPIGKRGYNEDEVDAFLDLVEAEMIARGITSRDRTMAIGDVQMLPVSGSDPPAG